MQSDRMTRKWILRLVLGLLTTTGLLLPIFSFAQESTGASNWVWRNPLPQGNSLFAIDCLSADDCLAVGLDGTVIKTSDGGTTQTVINASTRDLYDVLCQSTNNCLAVGANGTILASPDGGTLWTPRESGTAAQLRGIVCPTADTCRVVGNNGTSLISSDGGISWSSETTGSSVLLLAVDCSSTDSCVAIGNNGTVITTSDGGANWTPRNSGVSENLVEVDCEGTTCRAVGVNGVAITSSDSGETWSTLTTGTSETLAGLQCFGSTCVTVGGSGTILVTGNGGATWVSQISNTTVFLTTIDCADSLDNCRSVGLSGAFLTGGLGAGSWTVQSPIGDTAALRDIICPSVGRCLAIGTAIEADTVIGIVLSSNNGGLSWAREFAVPNQRLLGIDCLSSTECLAVGIPGVLASTTDAGNTWAVNSITPTTLLRDIACLDTTNCIAVGNDGSIRITNDGGANWSTAASGVSNDLRSISCTSATACLAVGNGGEVISTTDSGSSWSEEISGTTNDLLDIDCPSATECYASGASGTLIATVDGGSAWAPLVSGTGESLSGIDCPSATTCVAVGATGNAVVTQNSGTDWQLQNTGSGPLRAVHCQSETLCLAVNDNGTIIEGSILTFPLPTTTVILADTPDPSVPGEEVVVSYAVTADGSIPDGTINIIVEGDNTISCSGLLTEGNGSCPITFPATGSYQIIASYEGSAGFQPSVSPAAPHLVQTPSVTTLATAPNPSLEGENVIVTVAVVSDDITITEIPTGVVNITTDGGEPSCMPTLDETGTASCTLNFTTAGSYELVASYPGDSRFIGSTAVPVTQTVTIPQTTTTTVITNNAPNPANTGDAVTVSVMVTSDDINDTDTPTGSVTVSADSGGPSCIITPLASDGTGSCDLIFTTAGSFTLSADYAGDVLFEPSTSPGVTQTVNLTLLASTTIITANTPNPSLVGEAVSMTVDVAPVDGTITDIPTGSVTINADGGGPSCTIPSLDASGSGSCALSFASTGSYTLTAEYTGDTLFEPSTSLGVTQTVDPVLLASTTTITSNTPNPSLVDEAVSVAVAVASDDAGDPGPPTGSVIISSGTGPSCTIDPLSADGTGSCDIVFDIAGSYTLTAEYAGDTTFEASTSLPVTQTVNEVTALPTLTTLIAPGTASVGDTVVVSYSVAPESGTGTPSGEVSVSSGGGPNCSSVIGADGSGSCELIFTSGGTFSLVASYGGDDTFAASQSDPGEIVIAGLEGEIVVTTTDDVIDGNCATLVITDLPGADGQVSLKEAICAANNTVEADTISLTGGSTTDYVLGVVDNTTYGPTGLPVITSEITLLGNAANIIRDPAAPPFRILAIAETGNLVMEVVRLSNGIARGGDGGESAGGGAAGLGGAIYNRGTLAFNGSILSNNRAQGGDGAAGYFTPTLDYLGGGGGGLSGDGSDASETVPGVGGGGGGGDGGSMIGETVVLAGDGGFGGGGGGLSGAGGYGGGGGGFDVATPGGYGAGDAFGGGGGGAGLGGGIFNDGGTVSIRYSRLNGNTAQGGNGGIFIDSTVACVRGGDGGDGFGAALFNRDGTVNLFETIVFNNTPAAGQGGLGTFVIGLCTVVEMFGQSGRTDGGVYNHQDIATATLAVDNTVIANSLSGETDCYNDGGTVIVNEASQIGNDAIAGNACTAIGARTFKGGFER